jgi:hypothetical protein
LLNSNDTQNIRSTKQHFSPVRNKTGNGKLHDITHKIHLGAEGSTRGAMIICSFWVYAVFKEPILPGGTEEKPQSAQPTTQPRNKPDIS